MMVTKESIFITRGDSGCFTVRRKGADGAPASFLPGDTLHFTVKRFPGCAETLLQCVVTEFADDGAAAVELRPADTKALEPGRYCCDLQLTDRDGGVTTLLGPAEFQVGGDVTDE